MKKEFRSNCPISSILDLFGDKWSLLIVRDLLYYGDRTFKDFSQAGESISSARLSDRLSKLEELGIVTKSNHPTNKKVFIYRITEKGIDLAPMLAEAILWSYKYLPDHLSRSSKKVAELLKADREGTLKAYMSYEAVT